MATGDFDEYLLIRLELADDIHWLSTRGGHGSFY